MDTCASHSAVILEAHSFTPRRVGGVSRLLQSNETDPRSMLTAAITTGRPEGPKLRSQLPTRTTEALTFSTASASSPASRPASTNVCRASGGGAGSGGGGALLQSKPKFPAGSTRVGGRGRWVYRAPKWQSQAIFPGLRPSGFPPGHQGPLCTWPLLSPPHRRRVSCQRLTGMYRSLSGHAQHVGLSNTTG